MESRSVTGRRRVILMALDQTKARAVRTRSELVLVDEGAQDHFGQLGEPDWGDVVDEVALALNNQAIISEHVPQLHSPAASGGTRQAEAQLVDGEAEVFHLVVGEAQTARKAGGCDPGQPEELRQGGDNQSHFVARSHDQRTVAARSGSGWRQSQAIENNEGMNVVVCVKQIPDPAAPAKLDPTSKTLVREGKLILDESDSFGVEMGLQLADQAGGGDVTLVSMTPRNETNGLRTALAMGAAKAILVSDPVLAGSDALGTAKVLAAAIRRAEPDLVIAATDSTDGYTGTLPVQVAELLGLPSVTFSKQVTVSDGKVNVRRQTEGGYDEVEVPLPALITVTAGVVEPRYPSFKGIMAAKGKPVEELKVADLGVDAGQVGAAGAGQEVTSVEPAEARKAGEIVVDDGDGHEKIVALLEQLKLI
jgi:electron transfer flavoprotein beta subunit